jgi:hypothetical protein
MRWRSANGAVIKAPPRFRQNIRDKTGIALNAGLQLRINNRFYAMAQFSMEMGLGFNDTNEQNHLTGESKNYKATVFDFNQRGLIGDIGLYYRF